jgi:hypothetical protein
MGGNGGQSLRCLAGCPGCGVVTGVSWLRCPDWGSFPTRKPVKEEESPGTVVNHTTLAGPLAMV